jgi:16S rRNA (uracil1498-N3)-methyltransferase
VTLRLHLPPEVAALEAGADIALPEAAARHVQVRRLQPGDRLVLFDGLGHEAPAEVLAIGRRSVNVRAGAPCAVDRELPCALTLAFGMPANDRIDALVEKAAELGVARLQPLVTDHSVLRLDGERAARRRLHWQAIAAAACEQCGRARVPPVAPVRGLRDWLAEQAAAPAAGLRWVASLAPQALPLAAWADRIGAAATLLSGPEGGLTDEEEAAARSLGFEPVSLGARVLRADTAPLAALAWLAVQGAATAREERG